MIHLLEDRSQLSVQLQASPGEHSTVHSAFNQLLQFGPLLDDVDIKLRLVLYLYNNETLHNRKHCQPEFEQLPADMLMLVVNVCG